MHRVKQGLLQGDKVKMNISQCLLKTEMVYMSEILIED